jgi:hypothetical protein
VSIAHRRLEIVDRVPEIGEKRRRHRVCDEILLELRCSCHHTSCERRQELIARLSRQLEARIQPFRVNGQSACGAADGAKLLQDRRACIRFGDRAFASVSDSPRMLRRLALDGVDRRVDDGDHLRGQGDVGKRAVTRRREQADPLQHLISAKFMHVHRPISLIHPDPIERLAIFCGRQRRFACKTSADGAGTPSHWIVRAADRTGTAQRPR